jgi:hypothetical protein
MRSQLELLSRQRQALVSSLERVIAAKPRIAPAPARSSHSAPALKYEYAEDSDATAATAMNDVEGARTGVGGCDGPLPHPDMNGLNGAEPHGEAGDSPSVEDSCVRCLDWSQGLAPGFRRRLVRACGPVSHRSTHVSQPAAVLHAPHRTPFGSADSKKRRRAAENHLLVRCVPIAHRSKFAQSQSAAWRERMGTKGLEVDGEKGCRSVVV